MAGTDISDWWMTVGGGREPNPAEGFAAGQRMYENQQRNALARDEMAQRMEIAKSEMYVRGLDALSNALKVRTAISQREAQVAGFQEMSTFMADVAKNNAWDKPEARAQFWQIAARHPSIDADTIRQMDSSTFGEAVKRKELADRYATSGARTPASVAEFNFAKQLQDAYEMETDTLLKQKKLEELQAFQAKTGLIPGAESYIETVPNDAGDLFDVVWAGGKVKEVKARKTNSLNAVQKAMLNAEIKSVNDDWKNMDPRFIRDGKPDAAIKKREMDAIFQKYESAMAAPKKAAQPEATGPAAGSGVIQYDPTSRKLVFPQK